MLQVDNLLSGLNQSLLGLCLWYVYVEHILIFFLFLELMDWF